MEDRDYSSGFRKSPFLGRTVDWVRENYPNSFYFYFSEGAIVDHDRDLDSLQERRPASMDNLVVGYLNLNREDNPVFAD